MTLLPSLICVKKKKLTIASFFMASQTGIEPVSAAPEATVLSIGLLGPVFFA